MENKYKVVDRLFEMQDLEYAAFQAKLTPGIPVESFIGVRVPQLRTLAKEYLNDMEHEAFLQTLPHQYYDENMLHGLLISLMKDYDQCVDATERFLPYVDNWAVCDIMTPRVFGRVQYKEVFMSKIREWSASPHPYTCRFGLRMLMCFYLDADFRTEYLEIPASVRSDEYYVRMMVAWFFATALAKQWNATIPYIESRFLDPWNHNKTIQKARESYRITSKQKEYLASLRQK